MQPLTGPIRITAPAGPLTGVFPLPTSKSIANRLAMMRQLAGEGVLPIQPSDPDDVSILKWALLSNSDVIDVGMAGTAYRFLLPWLAMQNGRTVLLTGADRMLQRPIGPLVEALRQLGADIEYTGQSGFPPLHISGCALQGGWVQVDGSMSSQFASALLMIGPYLPQGLELIVTGETVSGSYTDLTVQLMRNCGATVRVSGQLYHVEPGCYTVTEQADEADWSAAAFAYQLAALRPGSRILLPGLKENSLQGDSAAASIFGPLGVNTTFNADGAILEGHGAVRLPLYFNLNRTPDLAQALLATCAGLGVSAHFEGIGHLAHKETDRLAAMRTELDKVGVSLIAQQNGVWHLSGQAHPTTNILNTYNDHRMAMCLAPLALLGGTIQIDRVEVVSKSFPGFWAGLVGLGFQID